LGLPCLTAARADLDELMALVARDPARVVRVSLETLDCVSEGFRRPVKMPANTREAFVSGAWDTTGMLLDRFDEVRRVASRLPYLAGFTAPPAA
jgi:3-isopropylmalate/(R)-2-methylmalate dehydratase small subunit